ncbi:MAG: DUF3014 domain-containing protein [Janthinobacterium lividum]
MPDRDNARARARPTDDFRPRDEKSRAPLVVGALALLAAGAGWWYWTYGPHQADMQPAAPTAAVAPPPDDAPARSPEPTEAPASGPQNPVDAIARPDAALPALSDADAPVASALTQLLGAGPMGSFLNVDGFVRRTVATVDNLTRQQAPSRVWPLHPTPGRFTVQPGTQGGAGGEQTIDAANAGRYAAVTAFAESVDVERAAKLYARFYPLFQQAYEELGYPERYFNDRLVAVIDHLIAAPEPEGPVRLKLTEVKGEYDAPNPWTRYEYVDPSLESLTSGQKMMVRVGRTNERRLKAKLAAFRAQIVTGTATGPASPAIRK